MNHWEKGKVMILSSNYGEGHAQAAKAVEEALKLHYPLVQSIVVDFMELTHPLFHPISRYGFIQLVKRFPAFYGYLFQKTRENNSLSIMLKKMNRFGLGRMLSLIREVQPTAIISTFPMAAGAVSMLKGYGVIDIPAVTIITDHTDHSYWIHPFTDQYIVGSDSVQRRLTRLGISESRIAVTGIPIRPSFCRSYSRDRLKRKHRLDPHLSTVLFMGGGYGLIGKALQSLQAIETLPSPIQIIFVCGHNDKLKKQVLEKTALSKHRVLVTGYIDYVHELMAVSDLMITKAGGLSTSEAIALELPMLLYQPLPGQERDNAAFLIESGVAIEAESIHELVHAITDVVEHPESLCLMKENAKRLNQKQAAQEAIDVILSTKTSPNYRWEEVYV